MNKKVVAVKKLEEPISGTVHVAAINLNNNYNASL